MTNIKVIDHASPALKAYAIQIRQRMPLWMKQSVLYVQSKIPAYPSPPPGSTYRRTGTLGRVLTAFGGGLAGGDAAPLSRVETFGDKTVGYIGGRLSYITYVVGDEEGEGQAWMHRGRWYKLIDVVRQNVHGVVDIFRDGIRDLIG